MRDALRAALPVLFGLLLSAMALFLIWFGGRLIWLGGSAYYFILGWTLLASGLLFIRRRRSGVWVYLAAWALTIPWTIWEVGFDWWGWLPRLFGPTLLAIVSLMLLPVMEDSSDDWTREEGNYETD